MAQSASEIEALISDTFTRVEPVRGPIEIAESFRTEQNHPAGIRAPHALEAMQEAAHVDRWDLEDGLYVSIALAPATLNRPYGALITGVESPSGPGVVTLEQAWRLYGSWPDTATSALAAFIERHGTEIIVGGEGGVRGLFVASFRGLGGDILAPTDPSLSSITTSVFFQRTTGGGLNVRWAYAIDNAGYRAYVSQNR